MFDISGGQHQSKRSAGLAVSGRIFSNGGLVGEFWQASVYV
jgi:hypothetical protein